MDEAPPNIKPLASPTLTIVRLPNRTGSTG